VKVFKKKNHQRNPKGEGQDQGHETTEGEGDIDQETIDIDGEDILQVHLQAAQIRMPAADHIKGVRRAKLKD